MFLYLLMMFRLPSRDHLVRLNFYSLLGAKCGSSTIDRHFQKLMEERFGDAYTSKSQKVIGPKSPFMSEFEEVKRRFIDTTLIDGIRLDLGLEDSEYYNKEDAEVTLTR